MQGDPDPRPTIWLASASPRRSELLAAMGESLQVDPADIDETVEPLPPAVVARRLSIAKAQEVAARHPNSIVIAADTVVALEEALLGKPADPADATAMLTALRDRPHMVFTGLTLVNTRSRITLTQVAGTPVRMRNYSDEEIARYVASGDPLDKAGAYAIQSADFAPVAYLEGCYANVVGFPMCHYYRAMRAWRLAPPVHPLRSCPFALSCGCPWSQGVTAAATDRW